MREGGKERERKERKRERKCRETASGGMERR